MMAEFPSGFFGPYDWASALAERKIPLIPGPLNSTLNPGRIGDPYASVVLNCNTQEGDWRIDARYRQFQATPATGTAGGIGYGESRLNKVFTITMPAAGNIEITFNGQTTAAIAAAATAATIKAALEAISTIDPGDVIVQGGGAASSTVTIECTGQYATLSTPTCTVSAGSIATTIAGGSFEEYVAVQNNALYSIAASELSNADGSVATAWSTLTDPGISAGAWTFWTVGKYIFWTTEQSSQRVYYKTIGLNDAKVLREMVGQTPDGTVEMAIPPYLAHTPISGTDVVTNSATAFGTMNSETIDASGNVVLDITAPSPSPNSVQITFQIDYDATNRPNLNNNDYIGLMLNCTFPFTFQSIRDVFIYDDGNVATQVPTSTEVSGNQMKIWMNLQGIPYASRDAPLSLRVRVTVGMQPGRGVIRLLPMQIGGVFLESGSSTTPDIANPNPNRPDVTYGYRYYRSATVFSDLRKLTLSKLLALGDRWAPSIPHLGGHAKLTIPDTASFGFGATDRIQLFRRTSLTADRTPGSPPAWFLLTEAANSADLAFTDDKTQQRVIQDCQDYGDIDIPGTVSTATSREVSGVTCGCAWKGANILFKVNGKCYGSSANRPFEILWDGITFGIDENSPGKARTFQVADNGLPVIACVAQDPLFMFTRKEGWVINGETFGSSGFPQRIQGVRGVVGRYGATKWKDGAIFASDDGLWYVEVPRYYSGEEGNRDLKELTQDQRPDWTTLLGSSPENTVVVEAADDIWCFNGTRYLHSPKPLDGMERFWIPGTWANDKSVQNAWGDPRRGVVIQFTDGTVGQIGEYLSDGGTNSAGSNGTKPSFLWTSKRFNVPASILAARAFFSKATSQTGGVDDTNARVRLNSERLASSEAEATLTFDAADGVQALAWDRLAAGGETGSNRWWEVSILGVAGDVFNHVELEIAPGNWGKGP